MQSKIKKKKLNIVKNINLTLIFLKFFKLGINLQLKNYNIHIKDNFLFYFFIIIFFINIKKIYSKIHFQIYGFLHTETKGRNNL